MTASSFGLRVQPHFRCMLRRAMLIIFTVLAGALISGCGNLAKSVYSRPVLDIPARWHNAIAVTGSDFAMTESWWRSFDDPQLDALIEKALRTNNDLAAATIAVYRARLQSRLADTNLTPEVTVQLSASNNWSLANAGDWMRASSPTTTISYELDLWGRLSRLRDASAWRAQATGYDRRATALSLIGTTATLYWKIAYQNHLIQSAKDSIGYACKTLELVEAQHAAGAVSEFEEAQSRANLATQQADLNNLIQQREVDRNALAILFDQSPDHREAERDGLAIVPMPPLPVVLPAELLGRRPDLQAAESRLRATLSTADATRLGFYPTFSLLGSASTSGMSLTDILKNPVGALGATLALPFIQWNTADLTIKVSRTDFDAAVVNFRQTFYQALSEVQSALSARIHLASEVAQRRAALDEARKAERLGEVRYLAGKTGLKDWLDLQQTRRDVQMSLEQSVYSQYVNQMTLYQALGGGAAVGIL
jgi:NodT family efflux transporter outer membrane factor (OMF) lipoprotein